MGSSVGGEFRRLTQPRRPDAATKPLPSPPPTQLIVLGSWRRAGRAAALPCLPCRRTALPAVPSWPRCRTKTYLAPVLLSPSPSLLNHKLSSCQPWSGREMERSTRETSVDICYSFLPQSPCHCIELHYSSIVY
jgi:hypothetical protein